MKKKEKELFQELCRFKSKEFNEALLAYATPSVLGHLFFNRMQGVAFGRLKEQKLLGKVNREFRNSLASAYEKNVELNQSFSKCIGMLSFVLRKYQGKVAMLKGAYLCAHYPLGYRTSNDIDLLISEENLGETENMLQALGFRQGYLKNGVFLPATRKEIIESKMLRGETVPFIKEIHLPYMQYLEIDLNFSLDYKAGDKNLISEMLAASCERVENELIIPTLSEEDFFIHLCAHLYKEATTLPWVQMHRDMTLYKYCDIYMLLSEASASTVNRIFERAKGLELEKECAFAVLQASVLFGEKIQVANDLAEAVLKDDPMFLHQVIDPAGKRILQYKNENIFERFFTDNRAKDLAEVKK